MSSPNIAINIKLRPSESMHELCVELRKSRKLAPIIMALMEGYSSDPYINNYVNELVYGGQVPPSFYSNPIDSLNAMNSSQPEDLEQILNYLEEIRQLMGSGEVKVKTAETPQPKPKPVPDPTPETTSTPEEKIETVFDDFEDDLDSLEEDNSSEQDTAAFDTLLDSIF